MLSPSSPSPAAVQAQPWHLPKGQDLAGHRAEPPCPTRPQTGTLSLQGVTAGGSGGTTVPCPAQQQSQGWHRVGAPLLSPSSPRMGGPHPCTHPHLQTLSWKSSWLAPPWILPGGCREHSPALGAPQQSRPSLPVTDGTVTFTLPPQLS